MPAAAASQPGIACRRTGNSPGRLRPSGHLRPPRPWWSAGSLLFLLLFGTVAGIGAEAPVADAAQAMDSSLVRDLLADGASPNGAHPDGMTALHWACLRDSAGMAQLLIDAGADASATNRYGVSPLSIACTNGNEAVVRMLLEAGADPDTTLPGGETALMTAARTGHPGPVEALLAAGADLGGAVHGMGRREGAGANAFNYRIRDPGIFDFETRAEQTALVWAAAEGHSEVVGLLIRAGADYRAALASGFTPFLFAVRNGHLGVVKTLVAAGADVNRRIAPDADWRHQGYSSRLRPGATALHVATENGHFDTGAFLLEAGADPNAVDPVGYAPLHAIVNARKVGPGDANPPPLVHGNLSSLGFVRLLARHGATVDAHLTGPGMINLGNPVLGPTAFLAAAQNADLELVRVLLEVGADPRQTNGNGSTALMLAGARTGTEREVIEVARLLLEAGVDPGAVDRNGETALHAAAYRDRPGVVRFLSTRAAADAGIWTLQNRWGLTPLAIATGYHGPRRFRPQPKSEAAIRELMLAAGLPVPEKVEVDLPPPTGY